MQVFETLSGAVYLPRGLDVSQEAALKHIIQAEQSEVLPMLLP